jgi:hypothetical protein
VESNYSEFLFVSGLKKVFWCFCLVDEVRIEDSELVSLNLLRWGVVVVVVCLVVFIPIPTCSNTIEISGFPRSILQEEEEEEWGLRSFVINEQIDYDKIHDVTSSICVPYLATNM